MRRSLFGRIALVVLLVWIGASAVIAIASVPLRRVPRLNPGPRLAQRAVHYFTQLIGVPPDYETAARIADELDCRSRSMVPTEVGCGRNSCSCDKRRSTTTGRIRDAVARVPGTTAGRTKP